MASKGLTLIEVLMVLAIASIMIAIGSVGIVKYLPDFQLSSSTLNVMAAMNKAKSEAVSKCTHSSITIDIPNNSYTISTNNGTLVSSSTLEDVQFHNCTFPSNKVTFDELGTVVEKNPTQGLKVFLKNSKNNYKGIEAFNTGQLSVINP